MTEQEKGLLQLFRNGKVGVSKFFSWEGHRHIWELELFPESLIDWLKWANTRCPELFHRERETAGACCPIRKRWELFAYLWSGCNPFHITGLRLWADILKEDEPEWLFGRRIVYPHAIDYTVVDPIRPIPEGLSEAMTSSLFASAVDHGKNVYELYGRKRRQPSVNPDATVAMERKEKCMDRKMRYPLEYAPFKDSIPSRKPMFLESDTLAVARAIETQQRRLHRAGFDCYGPKDGNTWAETKGERRVWHGNKKAKPEWLEQKVWERLKNGPEQTTKPLPATFAETVMLPLSKRIGWEGKGKNAVKYAKH